MFKKSMLLLTIFVLSLLCIFSACKKQQAIKKITVATDAAYTPMEYTDEGGNIVGFGIDITKAAAKEGGFEVEFIKQPWEGIFDGLNTGKYEAITASITITEERKQTMDFSIPYINAGQIIVVKQDSNVTQLSQLEGKKVGTLINSTGADEVSKNNKIILRGNYDEIELAIEDLANGRLDAVVCDSPIAANYVSQNPKYKPILKMAGDILTIEQYGIAIKKGNTEVLELINNGLRKVQEKGIDKALENKWLK